jgi:hypothetical protein
VVEPLGWQYPALIQALHFQDGVDIITRLTRMNHWVIYEKFKILTDVWIQAHYIRVLNGLTLAYIVLEAYGLGSNTYNATRVF